MSGVAPPLRFLGGYPAQLREQAALLLRQERIGETLLKRYPQPHGLRTDRSLQAFANTLRSGHMRSAPALDKVVYDSKLQVVRHALGTHTTISRVQGQRLKAKREIRIAALFKDAPLEFLTMITAHELAHLKEREHDRAFYALCQHMVPAYHQIEFDVRLYLTHLDAGGQRLWSVD